MRPVKLDEIVDLGKFYRSGRYRIFYKIKRG
jgi:hypothetical protein